jgi:hypothetical protein
MMRESVVLAGEEQGSTSRICARLVGGNIL